MEENRPFRRVLKRQKRAIRGSVNKVAHSSDVVVETLEDGSIEGIKLQYKPRYSSNGPNMTTGTLKEFVDWTPMADLLKGETHSILKDGHHDLLKGETHSILKGEKHD